MKKMDDKGLKQVIRDQSGTGGALALMHALQIIAATMDGSAKRLTYFLGDTDPDAGAEIIARLAAYGLANLCMEINIEEDAKMN